MSVPIPLCPNCGTPWPPGAGICPHCGFLRPVWPPPPVGFVAPRRTAGPLTGKLVTGKAGGDVLLGLAISVSSCLVTLSLMAGYHSLLPASLGWALGLLVAPVLYFVLRPHYPAVARGVGWGVLIGFVVLPLVVVAVLVAVALGILALCSSPNGSHN